ncbi:Aldehyde/histidinol dehydrogenase [Geopyxis carbonaria]|nr:Aldehyde/histidinol dehydrogenase [Geopyxis carbonaria]
MSSDKLLDYAATPVDTISSVHERITTGFASNKTRSLEFRKIQLRKLYWAVKDNEDRLCAALRADLGKPEFESQMAEVAWVLNDILFNLDHIDEWAKDGPAPVGWMHQIMSPRLRKEPIGSVLIIGAYNYPVQLTLGPAVGAIAAGCTVVMKPSEMTPHSAAIMRSIVEQLDPECYTIVNGAIPETTKLLELKWDKIMYTGNSAVGRIVAAAAAKHLTPVLLELGGQNPVLVSSKANVKLAAKRVLWSKVHNCGQICIAANHALVDASKETEWVEGCIAALKKFLPNGTKDPQSYGRIVNERHWNRISSLLDNTSGQIIVGGGRDKSELWIEPTVVKVTSIDDPLLKDEIFGPVLPYMVVEGGIKEMVKLVKEIGDCPLALYPFTEDKAEQNYILDNTRSGGASVNDTIIHAGISSMPFGGIGESGHGNYRGMYTFQAFTHIRPIITQKSWIEGQLRMRYPPYSIKQLKAYLKVNASKVPNFDRNCQVVYGSKFWRIVLLGGKGIKDGLLRYILTFIGILALKNVLVAGRK